MGRLLVCYGYVCTKRQSLAIMIISVRCWKRTIIIIDMFRFHMCVYVPHPTPPLARSLARSLRHSVSLYLALTRFLFFNISEVHRVYNYVRLFLGRATK